MPDLEIDARPDASGALVVTPRGELGLHNAPDLHAFLVSCIDRHALVVVELGDVGFVDSSALAVLVRVTREALDRGSRLRLRAAPGTAAAETLSVSALQGLLELDEGAGDPAP